MKEVDYRIIDNTCVYGLEESVVASGYPSGLLLTARITTNYLQLKSIYAQRKTHRLPEWKQFCMWVEGLPLVKELGVVPNDSSV